jgi:hypothetical protein
MRGAELCDADYGETTKERPVTQSPMHQATVPGVRSVTIPPSAAAAIRTENVRQTYTN